MYAPEELISALRDEIDALKLRVSALEKKNR
jgi:hypothetical protein